MVVIIRTVK